MKRKILSVLLVICIMSLFVFVGCSNSNNNNNNNDDNNTSSTSNDNNQNEPENETEKNSSNNENSNNSDGQENEDVAKGDMTIWYYWETEGHQKALNHIIDEFNGMNDNINVEAKYVPFADFKKQLSIGASADELPDFCILDNPDHAAYADMGIFADITDEFDLSSYYEGPVNSCTLDGRLYGVPFGSNCLALFYNEDMLNAADVEVPETWEELKDAAAKLTKDNVYGIAFSSLQNEEGTFNFLPWVWSTGATSYEIDSEGGIKALNLVKDLVDSGSMPVEAINWTQGDTMNQFISENLAMMINGTWQVPTMRQEVPDLNWNVAKIPQDEIQASGLGGENYAVIAGGNEAAAIEFLKYAIEKETCLYMMNAMGYISSDKTIAEGQFEGDEVYQVFVDELQYAQARGPSPDWPQISDAISLAFNEVITGESVPEDAATKAQETINSIINE